MKHISIAIDGPAGAGKSTLAHQAAQRLGFLYVDTGAIHRTVALKALESSADPADPAQVVHLHVQAIQQGDHLLRVCGISGRLQRL